MKKTQFTKLLSALVCIVLIAAIALGTAGCNDNTKDAVSTAQTSSAQNGEVKFNFTVVDPLGEEKSFEITTDKATVGEALLEEGLIAGEDGPYGLYVKTVNGTTLDYDTDGMYWAFYVDGEYATGGVDTTDVSDGGNYAFKAEK